MAEPPFSPTSEEPDGATVKEEPEDSCISFDEKPLQLEVECDPMDLQTNEELVQNDEPHEETRAERRRRMNRESRARRRAKMRAEKGLPELSAHHTDPKENSNALPEPSHYLTMTQAKSGADNQSCDNVPMFFEEKYNDENTIWEDPEERRKRLSRERQAKSRAKKRAENPEKVREADRRRKQLLRQRLKAENPEKLEQMRERERMRMKLRREMLLLHQRGEAAFIVEGDIKQECIDENAIVETPDERRKRLNRERQAKSKARKKAENPEKVREAERMKKRLQRQRLLAEDPEKLEKMRERDRMRAKRRRDKMLKQRDAEKAGEASAIVEDILDEILEQITPSEGAAKQTNAIGYIKEECFDEYTVMNIKEECCDEYSMVNIEEECFDEYTMMNIQEECINEDPLLMESPYERKKRLSRERQAKCRAKKIAENPEEFREKDRNNKYFRRLRKLAENPEKVREAERMRYKVWRLSHDIEKIRESERNRKRLHRQRMLAENPEKLREIERMRRNRKRVKNQEEVVDENPEDEQESELHSAQDDDSMCDSSQESIRGDMPSSSNRDSTQEFENSVKPHEFHES